jgi:hypothetical protein
MPQLRTKLSERMADKRQAKPRKFVAAFDDLTKMADVLFAGLDGDLLGNVQAVASPTGREAVEKLFPGYNIAWSDDLGRGRELFPDNWKRFAFDLPCLLQEMADMGLQHNLPKGLLSRRPISELDPDQLAALMTAGATDQGVRSAMWSLADNKITLISDPNTLN